MNRPKIYQLYYREDQSRFLDPAFTPWFNAGNPRPEWREYWVFRAAYKTMDFMANSHIGFVSWKFGSKCFMSGQPFVNFIQDSPVRDVYFVNPFPHATYLFRSVWTHGEYHHPGILPFMRNVMAKVHPGIDLDQLRTPPERGAYCNFWAGSEKFWKLYMDLCEPVFQYIENDATPQEQAFLNSIADPVIRTSYHSFIMERMFSTLLAIHPEISVGQYHLPERSLEKFYGHMFGHVVRAKVLNKELEKFGDLAAADRVRELFMQEFIEVSVRQSEIDSLRSQSLMVIMKRYLKDHRPRTYKLLKVPIKTLYRLANRTVI